MVDHSTTSFYIECGLWCISTHFHAFPENQDCIRPYLNVAPLPHNWWSAHIAFEQESLKHKAAWFKSLSLLVAILLELASSAEVIIRIQAAVLSFSSCAFAESFLDFFKIFSSWICPWQVGRHSFFPHLSTLMVCYSHSGCLNLSLWISTVGQKTALQVWPQIIVQGASDKPPPKAKSCVFDLVLQVHLELVERALGFLPKQSE